MQPTKEDLEAKLGFIEAYFDELSRRIEFLRELRATGHENEAMLLCCCYIDGLANYLYWPDSAGHRSFVHAVREFGPHEFLARIHPTQLREAIARRTGRRAGVALSIVEQLESEFAGALMQQEVVERFIAEHADAEIQAWIGKNLWRGTLASIAYESLRVPSVHNLGAAGAISFGQGNVDGDGIPNIDFEILLDTLQPIYDEARQRSITTNQWFGHDWKEGDGV